MAKCLKCKEEIDSLNYSIAITHYGEFRQENSGDFTFDETQDYWNEAQYIFSCPECSEVIFNCVEDAEEFLKVVPEKQITI